MYVLSSVELKLSRYHLDTSDQSLRYIHSFLPLYFNSYQVSLKKLPNVRIGLDNLDWLERQGETSRELQYIYNFALDIRYKHG